MIYVRAKPKNPYEGYLCPECGTTAVSYTDEMAVVHDENYKIVDSHLVTITLGCGQGHQWLIYLDDEDEA